MTPKDAASVDALRTNGITILDDRFPLEPFLNYLSRRTVYRNHVRQGKPCEGLLGSWPWMCHDMQDAIVAPGLLEAALSVLPIARAYLEQEPLLYSLNVFYTEPSYPGFQPKPDIQEFHRDADDSRFLALFVYCSDVLDETAGAHQFQVGTHTGQPSAPAVSILGPAGTMFLADTRGLHRGLVPNGQRRMIAWARWGVSDPPASYLWDGLSPTQRGLIADRYPADPELQNAIRLVVK